MANTPNHGFYYPLITDPADFNGDIQSLATSIDNSIDEIAQDAIGAAIAAGTQTNGVSVTYNDGANSLSFALSQDLRTSASPSFNGLTLAGTPTAPTAAVDTSTTQIATTAFVINQSYLKMASASTIYGAKASGLNQFASTTSAQLASVISDETGSGSVVFSNSPSLTGTPVAPTAAVDTNTTQLATTAFVINQDYLKNSVAAANYLTLSSASSTYLTQTSASTNYLTQASASATYLTQANASATYLTQASASATYAPLESYQIFELTRETENVSAGSSVLTFRAPYAVTLTQIPRAMLSNSSNAQTDIDINVSGSSIFTTLLSIDSGEKTSFTAATPAVLGITSIPNDAEITFDVDATGSGGKGLKVVLYYKRP